jgi:ABC-type glutathione transport system ATPase component
MIDEPIVEPLMDVAELSKRFVLPLPGNPAVNLIKRLRHGAMAAPRLHAVDDVSFSIGRGETVGLVGESGCGKSTLVRLVSRLLDPDDGSIRLGGKELTYTVASDFARAPDRGRIQMVFQDAGESINPRYTAHDAIADPLRRLRGLAGDELDARGGHALRLAAGLAVALSPSTLRRPARPCRYCPRHRAGAGVADSG